MVSLYLVHVLLALILSFREFSSHESDIVRSFILDITSCSHASSLLFAAVGHFRIQALVLEASDYDIADIL